MPIPSIEEMLKSSVGRNTLMRAPLAMLSRGKQLRGRDRSSRRRARAGLASATARARPNLTFAWCLGQRRRGELGHRDCPAARKRCRCSRCPDPHSKDLLDPGGDLCRPERKYCKVELLRDFAEGRLAPRNSAQVGTASSGGICVLVGRAPAALALGMDEQFEGGCLCGAVRFVATGQPKCGERCHCQSGPRHGGAPVSVFAAYERSAYVVTKGEIAKFNSSPGTRRGFCAKCGSTLTCESERRPETHFHIGAFDQADRLQPTRHIFTEERLPWLHLGAS
jgi:hypothetical protein